MCYLTLYVPSLGRYLEYVRLTVIKKRAVAEWKAEQLSAKRQQQDDILAGEVLKADESLDSSSAAADALERDRKAAPPGSSEKDRAAAKARIAQWRAAQARQAEEEKVSAFIVTESGVAVASALMVRLPCYRSAGGEGQRGRGGDQKTGRRGKHQFTAIHITSLCSTSSHTNSFHLRGPYPAPAQAAAAPGPAGEVEGRGGAEQGAGGRSERQAATTAQVGRSR